MAGSTVSWEVVPQVILTTIRLNSKQYFNQPTIPSHQLQQRKPHRGIRQIPGKGIDPATTEPRWIEPAQHHGQPTVAAVNTPFPYDHANTGTVCSTAISSRPCPSNARATRHSAGWTDGIPTAAQFQLDPEGHSERFLIGAVLVRRGIRSAAHVRVRKAELFVNM